MSGPEFSVGVAAPTLEAVRAAADRVRPHVLRTPVHQWATPLAKQLFGEGTEVWLKMELMQVGGSFKARGALNTAMQMDAATIARGFTAFSSGNHAIAVAYAAKVLGTSAKVVTLATANPARIAQCRAFGAEVLFAPTGQEAARVVEAVERDEGRVLIHPFDGPHLSEGSGTIALELAEQMPPLDAVVMSIGGGGLTSGLGSILKILQPGCQIYGVEPFGANAMYRSIAAGHPLLAGPSTTIADCLAPPCTMPYSFELCRRVLDDVVLVSDQALLEAMGVLFTDVKLAVEPGGAASTAAMMGPLRERLAGKRVGVILCGSNIDIGSLNHFMAPEALEVG